jgi:hypothetical protein
LPPLAITGGLVNSADSMWYSQLPENARRLTSRVMLTSPSSSACGPVTAISGSPACRSRLLPRAATATLRSGSSGRTSPKPVARS